MHPAARARREARAVGGLAGTGLAATTGLVRDTHLAIARRAFTLGGPGGRPAHLAHDAITRSVYAAVGGGLRAAGHAAGVVAALRTSRAPSPHPLTDRRRGNAVVGALNGAWGDRFEQWGHPLALGMTVRAQDGDVDLTRGSLATAFPAATGDVAVWLHGLCETDRSWRLGARDHYGDAASTHGSRLQAAAGLTSVYLRYNTGRHICANGEDLSRLLDELVCGWPVPVTRLTLVGHSMGGLVIRAACQVGQEAGHDWVGRTERIVYLGSPHLGAPLELAATRAAVALRRLPETKPIGDALTTRSVGIKDLRYGDVRPSDWADVTDLDAWRTEPADCAPLLDSATHYYIGATITRRHETVAARILGDAFVTWPSASGSGRRRRLALDVDRGRHLGGLHHFDLLNHPRVYAVLQDWLTG